MRDFIYVLLPLYIYIYNFINISLGTCDFDYIPKSQYLWIIIVKSSSLMFGLRWWISEYRKGQSGVRIYESFVKNLEMGPPLWNFEWTKVGVLNDAWDLPPKETEKRKTDRNRATWSTGNTGWLVFRPKNRTGSACSTQGYKNNPRRYTNDRYIRKFSCFHYFFLFFFFNLI